jgi:hypothetical protein
MLKKTVQFLRAPRLTITLLLLGIFLVFAGTLAQARQGIWQVLDQYFHCFIAQINLAIFFPHAWKIPELHLPFPGGFLIGTLLLANLIAVQFSRFKITAQGTRRRWGFIILTLGIFFTGITIFAGDQGVSSTPQDAFWRVLFRLGRGGGASLLLLLAANLLCKKKAGLALAHAGLILLIIGGFATAFFAQEGTMTLLQGKPTNFSNNAHRFELAITERIDSQTERTTTIPLSFLKNGARLHPTPLPFEISIHHYFPHTAPPEITSKKQPYDGPSAFLQLHEKSTQSAQRLAPAVEFQLIAPASQKILGHYLLSAWYDPNFSNRVLDRPAHVQVQQKNYTLYLRPRRDYLTEKDGHPFSITLLKFIHKNYEGTTIPKEFTSHIRLQSPSIGTDRQLRIWMNNPLRYPRYTFYQSGYLPDDQGSILQVVQNRGWMIPYMACMMILVGLTAHFIHQLIRARKE